MSFAETGSGLLCTEKYYQESEKTSHRMEKMLANHLSDKGFISRILKKTYTSSIKRPPNFKIGKGFE